jgi:hypothetical protein
VKVHFMLKTTAEVVVEAVEGGNRLVKFVKEI